MELYVCGENLCGYMALCLPGYSDADSTGDHLPYETKDSIIWRWCGNLPIHQN